ncbi:MAG: NTP transferase domain-containing protein [bacterium]|nr:NTP transferase domain-containing protein [bacterium]
MKAFVLAAGFGKRMGALTQRRPKPMLPLNGRPLIYYTLFQLYRWGVTEAMINLHYLGEQIESALQAFPHFPLHFSHEERLLGTAGGLRRGIELGFLKIDDWCLLANPDSLLQPEAQDAPPAPESLGSDLDALLYLKPLDPRLEATGFSFSADAKDLIHISPSGDYYYIGYGLARAGSVAHLPPGETEELRPIWEASGKRGRLAGRKYAGTIYDVGTADAYAEFQTSASDPIPAELAGEWRNFLADWARAPDDS